MEIAKITSKGQVTIPIDIRRKLGVKEGDASMEALRKAQAAFAGEAQRVGLKDENDVVAMIKELRRERKEQ